MQRKKIAVIGIGSFGKLFVRYLFDDGHEVIAIDKDPMIIDSIKDFVTIAVTLDATDEHALRSQGIADVDYAVIALADDFETSIICAESLKKCGVKNIYARYQTELQMKVLALLGIKDLFNPEEKAARSMAETLSFSGMRSSFLISDEYSVVEVTVPKRYINQTIADADLRHKYNINVITIKRPTINKDTKRASDSKSEKILGIPHGNTILKEDDIIVLFGSQTDLARFLET
ncbi:potassium channel family protein [Leptospira meyeri]|uniref:Trk system potassium uptake protein TrkA n=1 Tax=Leptospira meyeri TaxID=29508 RepID=A0A4V3HIS8_LEPME|nr:TrkA family potassium uptake protein [Leptospira meyeri]PKA23771.1 TrkA family potassium uptake protein [Leptospira sp. mixed culture ATI2-C-A1]EKJ86898.1 Trk system potassium uptake protein TrkA, N-terminal domain protein [Leptospira meyeri serovar Hardjo str. Went 5]MCW7488550.1 TrkA family potassium uptake protein [Leptospira meyeri]PJZ81286.1 TrkA family potassium uptake protein [Leptospira meyeri]PJZ96792.1 TrkA family potassium uptake protein [Leptospira meyeri]